MANAVPGPRNLITDVPGLLVGQAQDDTLKSGVTVLLGERPMVAGLHVMGGAPGTREAALLAPENTVTEIDSLVLSGGSAFGLASADGAMSGLHAMGRGYRVGTRRVPIVPAAILYDLASGGDKEWTDNPYAALGRRALDAAGTDIALGSHGAGTGAIAGRIKGGIGSASATLDDGTMVGALVAANPVGSVLHPETGQYWAAAFEYGSEMGGHGIPPAIGDLPLGELLKGANTTIAIVATDATLDKGSATRLAVAAHDGMARAIVPSHTPFDGDLVFAASTARRPQPDAAGLLALGHAASCCLARAIGRAVHLARPAPGDAVPTWHDIFGG
ncbi:P1 family peptidase [Palleronia sp. LCG004]|uniref:P1 family peptidase n=1 Tax=Palleronia sp. LCG004 TaxID=3079304 RepID=UPI002942148B|nr:P1 family peptidase [Palleronia sp. LCG004]WOI57413.1 P1 family peptidase [Palleronia sp. LCG004]